MHWPGAGELTQEPGSNREGGLKRQQLGDGLVRRAGQELLGDRCERPAMVHAGPERLQRLEHLGSNWLRWRLKIPYA